MAYKMAFKVYGAEGHRQRMSFEVSEAFDFTDPCFGGLRLLKFENFDKTGTHDYTLVTVIRDSKEKCQDEFWGQVTDGYFENARTGKIEKIFEGNVCLKDVICDFLPQNIEEVKTENA